MPGIQQFLAPQVLTKVISQVATTSDWYAALFGVNPGGKNVIHEGHSRVGAFHIYNHLRKVAAGRAPGTAAGRRAPNPMGRTEFTYPRMHDSVPLSAEVMHNLGQIANPAMRDKAGADMIKRQTSSLGQLAANWRKAMLIGTNRDSLYVGVQGDDVWFDFKLTAGVLPVFQQHARMPAANKNRLNMLGTGNIINASWGADTTNIIQHLTSINAAFQILNGGHLAAIVCGQNVWNAVVQNEFVRNIHGSANAPFRTLEVSDLDPEIAKTMKNVQRMTLNAWPNTVWYVTDEVIEVGQPGSESLHKIVEDNHALFIGHNPDDGTITCLEGSEPISEFDGAPTTVKIGLESWSVPRSNPTSTDLFVLDNAIVVNHVPNSHAYGQVIF